MVMHLCSGSYVTFPRQILFYYATINYANEGIISDALSILTPA